jgi:hypothetical protein
MDINREYYARLMVDDFKECELINNSHQLCKQNYPVQVKHLGEAELLQSIRSIPICSQRMVELNQALWTKIQENEWLCVAPRVDTLTALFSG